MTSNQMIPCPSGATSLVRMIPALFLLFAANALEATSFYVDNTNDSGAGSLRRAINDANADQVNYPHSILFMIGGDEPPYTVKTIRPLSPLPAITNYDVDINGYSQYGASPATSTTPAKLMIELDGSFAGPGSDGIVLSSAGSTSSMGSRVRGLVINRFGGNGIDLEDLIEGTIEGNFIGTDTTGTVDMGNDSCGVNIARYTWDNTIGGTTPAARNVISGNGWCGVEISGWQNLVSGNYVGTDCTGTQPLGNSLLGVSVYDAPDNTIEGNLISANADDGVGVVGANAHGCVVQGNLIGTDITGMSALGNGGNGVYIYNTGGLIGGQSSQTRNIISGNAKNGIYIDGYTYGYQLLVQGNYIGTDISGMAGLGNGDDGVFTWGGPDITIGGTQEGMRNIISGNDSSGVRFYSFDSYDNKIQGNYIGTDLSGSSAIPNLIGVTIEGPDNTVGGTADLAPNVISGNDSIGVLLHGSSSESTLVQGNYIGTDATGMASLGNGAEGISIWESSENTVGGVASNAHNVISGNVSHGINITTYSFRNTVQGNYVGVDLSLTTPLPNAVGVLVKGDDNTIGGALNGAGNTIAHNEYEGVWCAHGTGNAVLGNSIYFNGNLGIDLWYRGVTMNDSADVDTGGANNEQNYPILTAADVFLGATTIHGVLESTPNAQFRIEFFWSETFDPSGFGEGQELLGSTRVSTDIAGAAPFVVNIPVPTDGFFITATATDTSNNTSEFGEAILCTPFVLPLNPEIVGGEFVIQWETIPEASAYWVYGALNEHYFQPGFSPDFEHRIDFLPAEARDWASPNGIGDPGEEWTYMVIPVNEEEQELCLSDRVAESDFVLP